MNTTDLKPTPAATLFLFGAHGDLAQRLLVPALYRLCRAGLLNPETRIVGVDHNEATDEAFRERIAQALRALASDPHAEGGGHALDHDCWCDFSPNIHYQTGDFLEDDTYAAIAQRLDEYGGNAIFYLGTAPRFFGPIVEHLAQAGLLREAQGAFRRVAVEKPFGIDLDSARALNATLRRHLEETQIYRVDHFAGKDAARNLAVYRFASGFVEPFWHRDFIDSVQISAVETLGVEGRGRFYEATGALRDMVQNHLLQLLALVAMEPPQGDTAADWQAAKTAAVAAIRCPKPAQAADDGVRGQYSAPPTGDGKAYRDEKNVESDSTVETYVALRLMLDTPRWQGVPFYLRTGKRLSRRATEIVIQFRQPQVPGVPTLPTPTRAILRLDPETLVLEWPLREPGPGNTLTCRQLALNVDEALGQRPGSGYETLLYGCLQGDATHFQSAQEVEAAWAAVAPFQAVWSQGTEPEFYHAGSDGPEGARTLIERDGRQWWEPAA
ncbi:glucose-6-phosphate dehydrogenase [Achromobacter sp. GG226]|uniref:glucose-6-phosphate dehydrogenase n=1 Tax=Verticiella alkaliphila TaxID=2779529 RepID=UPI001C0B1799|nr:glucose-6-phosphate dehydrogenase [Verticiella sp. GG226]MBU4610079.1 glucose-6-phosphate dehydrogenase [Verticiella sp. GG226]